MTDGATLGDVWKSDPDFDEFDQFDETLPANTNCG